jgi:hypothetical protein
MPKVRSPVNALDTFQHAVRDSIEDCSVSWHQSEYCDQTFIVMMKYGAQLEIEINLRFYPEFYAMSTHFTDGLSNTSINNFTKILRNNLDMCIYY